MADLRDNIRRAICEADGFDFDTIEPGEYGDHADAVLAILAKQSTYLEDCGMYTAQELQDAGEACIQQACRSAVDRKTLDQERYSIRCQVGAVIDDIDDLAADGQMTNRAADRLRGMLRDAIGLTTTGS